MKILASIPYERVDSPGSHTFKSRNVECTVVRLMRSKCDSWRNRYYYSADVIAPECLHPDYPSGNACDDGTFRVNVVRFINPAWKPPVFPEGHNVLEVTA